MVLLFAGVVWFLSRTGTLHVAADTLLSILLICIGAGLLITRRSGRKFWPILLGGVVLFVLMGSSASTRIHWHGPGGEEVFAPTSAAGLPRYQVPIGNLRLDLTGLDFTDQSTTAPVPVVAKVGLGDLDVVVPTGVGVQVKYKDGFGDVNIEEQQVSHGTESSTWRSPGYETARKRLNLDLEVGSGAINVTSAPSRTSFGSVPTVPPRPAVPKASTSGKQQ